MKKLTLNALAAAALLVPSLALAESTSINPATTGSAASARLDFTVVIPAVLYLRVGAGNAIGAANNGTINAMTFTVPGANIGDGTPVAGSVASGDLGNGSVTVRVFSNFGTNVSLNSTTTGQLSNGSGDNIPWTQIAVVAAADPTPIAGFTNTGIAHPTFNNGVAGGAGTATVLAAASKLVRQQGQWTFSYSNANLVPAGTYGTSIANNGRVTYTATQL